MEWQRDMAKDKATRELLAELKAKKIAAKEALDHEEAKEQDAKETAEAIRDKQIDWIIIDHYNISFILIYVLYKSSISNLGKCVYFKSFYGASLSINFFNE